MPLLPGQRLFRWLLALFLTAVLGVASTAAINWHILRRARGKMFTSTTLVPPANVAIVLGTSPTIGNKWKNPFFTGRMDAAAALFHAGKTRHFLLSGDNGHKSYDEPSAMREALIARGVPASAITLDYAGFRTLDTMARANAIFGITSATIVTDDFHLARSLYLADSHGISAQGFSGIPVPKTSSRKTRWREIASRVAAWLDVHILRTEPKFYGPKETLPMVQR